ncbi:hypothetical protein A3850_000855 [Lewinella sp. 4G2]|nr:hypothetical protein A3850_000855 [Lewinella sp. 4G2]
MACQPTSPTDGQSADESVSEVRSSPTTQALLLTQPVAFDASDANRVEGAYVSQEKLTVPSDLSPQNKWIMFEGPVLENDRVAFRYYADSRHRFDIYGKSVSDLVMDTVSWNYHDIMDWGSDILKVGNSLGLGSPAIYTGGEVYALSDCEVKTIEVVESGGDLSLIRTTFKGLKVEGEQFDLVQDWSIAPGDYYSTIELYLPSGEELPEGMQFATGIVSHLPEATFGQAGDYSYLMNWGKQSYHKEQLGMAIVADTDYAPKQVTDPLSHLMVFENAPQRVSYRLIAVWERDQSGTKDEAGFLNQVRIAAN